MIITRYEKYFFKFIFSDKIIGINPPSKKSKLKTSKFGADIVLSNIFHPDFNGYDFMNYKGKKTFIIKGPGEYEISGIYIKGIGLKTKFKNENKISTSYTMFLDGINIAIFGPINSGKEFTNDEFEEFSNADIFIIQFGCGDTFSPKDAWKFIKQFGPKIIIPIVNSKEDLEEFKSEIGVEVEKIDKLILKQKDILTDGILKIYDLKIS